MSYESAAALLTNALVVGSGKNKKLFVVTAPGTSVKAFEKTLVGAAAVKPTKRFNEQRALTNTLTYFVRNFTVLKGKRLADVKVVAPTDKEGLFRDRSGHFVKVEGAVSAMRA